MNDDVSSLSHAVWECKYHIVWIPKYRKKTLYGQLRKYLGEVFRRLARQKESEVVEGHLMLDHVHMLISVPPKCGVPSGWLHERQKRYSHCKDFHGTRAEFYRPSFLGKRLLCLDHRQGREGYHGIYQETGRRRSKARPAENI